jgi:hypothetical protein
MYVCMYVYTYTGAAVCGSRPRGAALWQRLQLRRECWRGGGVRASDYRGARPDISRATAAAEAQAGEFFFGVFFFFARSVPAPPLLQQKRRQASCGAKINQYKIEIMTNAVYNAERMTKELCGR